MNARTSSDLNEAAGAAATDFTRHLVSRWQGALGADLLGAYLMGSLAHDGFSRRYSDVDIAVVSATGLAQVALAAMRRKAVALSSEWGPRLSLFWTDRRFGLGRFPPLDRIDYLDHAVALAERERVQPPRPTLGEIRRQLSTSFADWKDKALRFAASPVLEPRDRKSYLRTLLYPARFFYSWTTGRVGSNDAGVAFLTASDRVGFDLDLIDRALQCRQAGTDPDALFASRAALVPQVEACGSIVFGTSD